MSEINLMLDHAASAMTDAKLAGGLTGDAVNEINDWLDDDAT
jgi:hypothetical protein